MRKDLANTVSIIPTETIEIYREDSTEGFRWQYCYLHGEAEAINEHDIFMASIPMPTEPCVLHVDIQGHSAIAVIEHHYGILSGRIALASDKEALDHAMNEGDWR